MNEWIQKNIFFTNDFSIFVSKMTFKTIYGHYLTPSLHSSPFSCQTCLPGGIACGTRTATATSTGLNRTGQWRRRRTKENSSTASTPNSVWRKKRHTKTTWSRHRKIEKMKNTPTVNHTWWTTRFSGFIWCWLRTQCPWGLRKTIQVTGELCCGGGDVLGFYLCLCLFGFGFICFRVYLCLGSVLCVALFMFGFYLCFVSVLWLGSV